MVLHRNAKLGLAGRYALVLAVEDGLSLRAAAAAFNVSPATACRWSRRWREAGQDERRTLECLHDRSSRPRRMPRLLALTEQRRICAARRRSGWGPRLLTVRTGHGHYARFTRPGHAVTGDRSSTSAQKRAHVGYDHAHAIVDDHSRLAYAELLADERAQTVTDFVVRALAFFAAHGIEPKRVMTDNAWSYTLNRSLQQLLVQQGIRHVRTPKRRPQPNGKVERFHQTMAREWAYGVRYRSHRHRAAALPHWLRHYNEHRPHSPLGGLPPLSRVHNVRRQDS